MTRGGEPDGAAPNMKHGRASHEPARFPFEPSSQPDSPLLRGPSLLDRLAVACGLGLLLAGVIQFSTVFVRTGPLIAPVWLAELATNLHAIMIFLAVGITLAASRHVRLSGFKKAGDSGIGVRLLSVVLAVAFSLTLAWVALPYVLASWQTGEGSREIGGLSGLYWVKSGLLLLALGIAVGAVVSGRRGSKPGVS
ncbi:MAG: hypothetical protein AAGI12_00425 [Pseudomonadota bacterium]